jgi:dTDP-4-dehydrorhamnose reductase
VRVLITGGAGTLGCALAADAPAGADLHATIRARRAYGATEHLVDLADPGAVAALLAGLRPDVIIHTAYDPTDLVRGVVDQSVAVAESAAALGARLIHLSSDRVLDGEHAPYEEHAVAAPIEPYGEAKAEAERRVGSALPTASIIRTSLIVATDPPDPITAGRLDAMRRGAPDPLFVDEIRCPIHAPDLARQIWEIAALPAEAAAGVWNLVGPEAVSRFALALLVGRRWGLDTGNLVPVLNRAHPAPRPRDLRLSTGRADAALRSRARPISEALLVG